MEITWLGHSSFLIEDSKGRKILTDPFDETVGYEIYRGIPDLVTMSHHHFDHDYVREIPDNVPKLDEPGTFNIGDIKVTGIPSYHDGQKGAKRGKNTIFIIETDNYRICHLGDLGYVLTQPEINALGKIDVLMIPVGGTFTIDGSEAAALAKAIGSHLVIPMHYKTPVMNFNITGPENFLKLMEDIERIDSTKLKVEGQLKGTNQIKILNYK